MGLCNSRQTDDKGAGSVPGSPTSISTSSSPIFSLTQPTSSANDRSTAGHCHGGWGGYYGHYGGGYCGWGSAYCYDGGIGPRWVWAPRPAIIPYQPRSYYAQPYAAPVVRPVAVVYDEGDDCECC